MSNSATGLAPDQVPDAWNATAVGYDQGLWDFMTPYARDLVGHADLAADQEVLDVAAGNGRVSVEAAPRVRRVLATDFAEDMLARARVRAAEHGLDNIEYAKMDGQALELPDASFDRVVCNFGVIFFPDQEKGFREMHRVLRPGGRAAVSIWSDPTRMDFFRLFGASVREALPDLELPETPPVFRLCDPTGLGDAMRNAGFGTVDVHTVTHEHELESAAAMWDWMRTSAPPVAALLGALPEAAATRLEEAVIARTRAEKGEGPVILSHEAHIGIAHR